MNPVVSVIIPTFNREEILRRAVASVLAQTFSDFEIIVVDDHSEKPASEVLEDINDPRLAILRHEVNQGQGEARNTGIAKARGEWIAFLDDDIWFPKKLEKQLAYVRQQAVDVDAVLTDYYDTMTGNVCHVSKTIEKKGAARSLVHWEGFVPSMWMVRRSVFDVVGGFDPHFRRAQDWEWIMRFYLAGRTLTVVPEVLLHYDGIHPKAITKELAFVEEIAAKHRPFLSKMDKPELTHFLDIFVSRRRAHAARLQGYKIKVLWHWLLVGVSLLRIALITPKEALRYSRDLSGILSRKIFKVKKVLGTTIVFDAGVEKKNLKKPPMVSVIIPTFNREEILRRAVVSVLAQTFSDFEIIVVDDYSKKPASEVLKDINDPRIIILRHEVNQGLSKTRNTGINKAQGEWIAFLDDDDFWLPEKLQKQVAYAQETVPNVNAVLTDFYNMATGFVHKVSATVEKKGAARSIVHWEGFAPSMWMVRRSVFDRVGFFDPAFRLVEDWEWLLRFYLGNNRIGVVPAVLMHYDGNHTNNIPVEMACVERVAEKYRPLLSQSASPEMVYFMDIFTLRRRSHVARHQGQTVKVLRHWLMVSVNLFRISLINPKEALRYSSDLFAVLHWKMMALCGLKIKEN